MVASCSTCTQTAFIARRTVSHVCMHVCVLLVCLDETHAAGMRMHARSLHLSAAIILIQLQAFSRMLWSLDRLCLMLLISVHALYLHTRRRSARPSTSRMTSHQRRRRRSAGRTSGHLTKSRCPCYLSPYEGVLGFCDLPLSRLVVWWLSLLHGFAVPSAPQLPVSQCVC